MFAPAQPRVRLPGNDREHLRTRAGIRLADACCIGYLTLTLVGACVFRERTTGWLTIAIRHAAALVAIAGILRFTRGRPETLRCPLHPLAMLRTLYPLAVIALAWPELDALVPMLRGDYWATGLLVQADRALLGLPPTLWCERLYNPILDELMNVFYSGYYGFMPLVVGTLILDGKWDPLARVVSLAGLAYLACDLAYIALPALGPRMAPEVASLRNHDFGGYLFAGITRFMQSTNGVRGACFPSSHVVGAILWAGAALRYERRLGAVLLPIAAGVPAATVYLGYHHAVDALAGCLLGIVLLLGSRASIRSASNGPGRGRKGRSAVALATGGCSRRTTRVENCAASGPPRDPSQRRPRRTP